MCWGKLQCLEISDVDMWAYCMHNAHMIRTQIQLEPETYEQVKARAAGLGCSISEVVRRSVVEFLSQSSKDTKWKESLQTVGRYKSGLRDLSTNHDSYLGDDW
jgi:Arc/MetJ-type ribon-helix-helix transcriptional regulator